MIDNVTDSKPGDRPSCRNPDVVRYTLTVHEPHLVEKYIRTQIQLLETYATSYKDCIFAMCSVEIASAEYSYGAVALIWQIAVEFDESYLIIDL